MTISPPIEISLEVRRVNAKDHAGCLSRLIPNSEMGLGGTGNLPVLLGHWPNGTERILARETTARKSSGVPPVPSGGSPLGTGGSPATLRSSYRRFGIRVDSRQLPVECAIFGISNPGRKIEDRRSDCASTPAFVVKKRRNPVFTRFRPEIKNA